MHWLMETSGNLLWSVTHSCSLFFWFWGETRPGHFIVRFTREQTGAKTADLIQIVWQDFSQKPPRHLERKLNLLLEQLYVCASRLQQENINYQQTLRPADWIWHTLKSSMLPRRTSWGERRLHFLSQKRAEYIYMLNNVPVPQLAIFLF